ncbi:MAG: type II toxin-antitoxin system YafQ family toxin [Eubacteriales bacterium]|nr:type II toxin-antitoxin system YafQ family toxin [Eubacteriales bacterium]
MLDIVLSNQFRKDLKLCKKRGYDLEILNSVIEKLAAREKLPERNRDHELSGNYAGFRECHIQPDWLLVYRINNSELILFLSRTGTHSDLF